MRRRRFDYCHSSQFGFLSSFRIFIKNGIRKPFVVLCCAIILLLLPPLSALRDSLLILNSIEHDDLWWTKGTQSKGKGNGYRVIQVVRSCYERLKSLEDHSFFTSRFHVGRDPSLCDRATIAVTLPTLTESSAFLHFLVFRA